MKKIIACLLLIVSLCTNVYAQETYVFFGSFNWDAATTGLYVYKLDTHTGQLTPVTTATNIKNPSFLTVSPNGSYVYACTDSKTPGGGSVSSFKFSPKNKTLTFINKQGSGGENPVYVSVHNNSKWLVNANYTQGSVSVHPLAADGSIGSIAQNFKYSEGSVKKAQDRSHVHSAVFSPNFDYLFLPDLGADKIRCYRFDDNLNEPLQNAQPAFVKTEDGSGPRHFIFHPNGKFAYCIEELSGMVSVYAYSDGVLNSIQKIAAHPETITDGFESSDIHVSPDGKFLYASNRGQENNIAIFAIASDGMLTAVGYQSTLGNHPRVFAIDETGKFLIATNVNSGNVVVFKRDFTTGLLERVGAEIQIKNVSCVQIKSYSQP